MAFYNDYQEFGMTICATKPIWTSCEVPRNKFPSVHFRAPPQKKYKKKRNNRRYKIVEKF